MLHEAPRHGNQPGHLTGLCKPSWLVQAETMQNVMCVAAPVQDEHRLIPESWLPCCLQALQDERQRQWALHMPLSVR